MGVGAHSSHPDFGHLVLLVFEAVLEVVCVSLPGYIVARQGMFGADAQKLVANLNVQLFTPCLVFTKLASQLTPNKLADLGVIPVIFVVQTLVSWACAAVVSRGFRFNKKQANFVTAMAVFGNSNSLPISLVVSLSKTLSGLHWDRIPGDNDNEVAARGILYLVIFQQLGQLVRWSWGYNVLLKPRRDDGSDTPRSDISNSEEGRYRDDPDREDDHVPGLGRPSLIDDLPDGVLPTPSNGNAIAKGPGNMGGHEDSDSADARRAQDSMVSFPSYRTLPRQARTESFASSFAGLDRFRQNAERKGQQISESVSVSFVKQFRKLPKGLQTPIETCANVIYRFFYAVYANMNPPLWALLVAIVVASIPPAQHALFDRGTFLNNSVARAIAQSGGVAVPLILVVLGANLARNTIPQEELASTHEEKREERNLLIAALVSRMLLPTLILTPFLALFAKYVPVSILDDPIFIIVCFLLTGAPSALQLAQICQLHNVFTGVMSRLLFQSYVVWYVLPNISSSHMLTRLAGFYRAHWSWSCSLWR